MTTIVASAGMLITLLAYLHAIQRGLKTDIARLDAKVDATRTELKTDIAGSHADAKSDLGRVEDRLTAIESRTYDISARLPPAPASTPTHT